MRAPFCLVDAFAEGPLRGNPAGVILLEQPLSDEAMQEAAHEVQQPETAFLVPLAEAWSLRWMTPTVEVELCGHATLAAAAALLDWGLASPDRPLRFATRSGELRVTLSREEWIEMDFPSDPPSASPLPQGLCPQAVWTGRTKLDWFAELPSWESIRDFQPNMEQIAEAGLRGLIITAPGLAPDDVCSRFFAPQSGVPEDGVTGSAHCALAPYWSAKLGLPRLSCLQASSRGGRVLVEPRGDRTFLRGQARIRIRGSFDLLEDPRRPVA